MTLDMNKYDALTKQDIIDLLNTLKTANSVDTILSKINELALEKYDLGFNDGYDEGSDHGWDTCYDQYEEEINS